MITPTGDALEAITQDFLISNTPYFLFKRLRGNAAPAALSKSSTPTEIHEFFETLTGKKEKTASEVAQAYACILALAEMEHPDARQVLKGLPVHRLDWGIDFRAICVAKLAPEVRLNVSLKEMRLPLIEQPIPGTASTSVGSILPMRIEQRPG